MNKALSVVIALVLLASVVFADDANPSDVTVTTGVGIGVGVDPENSCPEIVQEHGDCQEGWQGESVCYWVDTTTDLPEICKNDQTCIDHIMGELLNHGIVGRSYAFEGEEVHFNTIVLDKDGIVDDCVKVFVTLDNGVDPRQAGCSLVSVSDYTDPHTGVVYANALGTFSCIYTVEPAEGLTQGEYWISVEAADNCGEGCHDYAAGLVSLYLNPEVSLTISSQDQFKFDYDISGDEILQGEGPYAGETVYSPYFTVENTADPDTGLYILLQLYGTDMWDYSYSAAMCPTSNVLHITNVEYKASHLNVQQPWTVMPENYAGKNFVFRGSSFGGNFLGVGDDITMRLRLNIPSPCRGSFTDGGQIVFVGHVL